MLVPLPPRRVMAIHCRNETSLTGWQQWRWLKLLRLAAAHGWKPMGTTQPPEEAVYFPSGWDSNNYTTNDGQIVSEPDARALADALEASLPHIPDSDALAKYRLPDWGDPNRPNPPIRPRCGLVLRRRSQGTGPRVHP